MGHAGAELVHQPLFVVPLGIERAIPTADDRRAAAALLKPVHEPGDDGSFPVPPVVGFPTLTTGQGNFGRSASSLDRTVRSGRGPPPRRTAPLPASRQRSAPPDRLRSRPETTARAARDPPRRAQSDRSTVTRPRGTLSPLAGPTDVARRGVFDDDPGVLERVSDLVCDRPVLVLPRVRPDVEDELHQAIDKARRRLRPSSRGLFGTRRGYWSAPCKCVITAVRAASSAGLEVDSSLPVVDEAVDDPPHFKQGRDRAPVLKSSSIASRNLSRCSPRGPARSGGRLVATVDSARRAEAGRAVEAGSGDPLERLEQTVNPSMLLPVAAMFSSRNRSGCGSASRGGRTGRPQGSDARRRRS